MFPKAMFPGIALAHKGREQLGAWVVTLPEKQETLTPALAGS